MVALCIVIVFAAVVGVAVAAYQFVPLCELCQVALLAQLPFATDWKESPASVTNAGVKLISAPAIQRLPFLVKILA